MNGVRKIQKKPDSLLTGKPASAGELSRVPGANHHAAPAASSPIHPMPIPVLGVSFASTPVNTPRLQYKLAVNEPGDEYEREADAVAERVMCMADPLQAGTAIVHAGARQLQRKCAHCEEEEEHRLQRKETGAGAATVPPIVHQVLKSSGQPLDASTRAFMELRFRQDFSRVRLHSDTRAAESARVVNARAYTIGNNIVFASGQYAPHTQSGKSLLAHELSHVLQQSGLQPLGLAQDNNKRRDSLRRSTGADRMIQRVAWTPTRADERNNAGVDRFASQTFELTIPSLTGESGRTSVRNIMVSVFVPSGAINSSRNNVHIFFGPGSAVQTGLPAAAVGMNAVMTHGFRGASDATEWILIGVPGAVGPRGEANAFNTIDTAGVRACLTAAGRPSTTIDALRLSSHSRGSRGLRETLERRLIPTPVASRVVVFDAAFSSLNRALARSGIPGANLVALNVVDPGRLSVRGARNINLDARAMRAIGYSRIIQDAMTVMPGLVIPPAIRAQLLRLPARGRFTTASPPPVGMININDFSRSNASAIRRIVQQENNSTTGLKTFIDAHNLIRLGMVFSSDIYSHHLFVAELAHEAVD